MIEGNTSIPVGGLPPTNETKWLGPKPWAEISVDEKLERLRRELDDWRRECARLRGLVTLMQHHQHGANGTIQVGLMESENFFRMENAQGAFNMLR